MASTKTLQTAEAEFKVDIRRTSHGFSTININAPADTPVAELCARALEQACDNHFSDASAEYEITDLLQDGKSMDIPAGYAGEPDARVLLSQLVGLLNEDKDGGYFICEEGEEIVRQSIEFCSPPAAYRKP